MSQWWDAARIEAIVIRQFVETNLRPDYRARLDQPVGSGDFGPVATLPASTYWEWIRARARRTFLILVDVGLTDQIFGLADDSWADSHLPLPLESVRTLALTASRDDKVERKFFRRQFHYLLRHLRKGEHAVYADAEVVPLDVVDRPAALNARGQLVDRVKLPNEPDRVFCRRRFPLGNGPGQESETSLVQAVRHIQQQQQQQQQQRQQRQNGHIVSYWASYTHQGTVHVLFTPASDLTLRSFLAAAPRSFAVLPKKARRELVLNWILCLVDTLCHLHVRDRSHGCIKPSTVLLDHRNHIFFADSTRLSPESWASQAEKSSFDREWYDYAAPEQWSRPTPGPGPGPGAGLGRHPAISPGTRFSRPLSIIPASASSSSSSSASSFGIQGSSDRATDMPQTPSHPDLSPQPADVFSLGCIILELLTFLVGRPSRGFAAYRSQRRKSPGRGGAVGDASFHKNLGQVEAWMAEVARDAARKGSCSKDAAAEGANVLRGVTPILHLVTCMLSVSPHDRPAAVEAQQGLYRILVETCGISEPHCVHQYEGGIGYSPSDHDHQPLHRIPELDGTPVFHSVGSEPSPHGAETSPEMVSSAPLSPAALSDVSTALTVPPSPAMQASLARSDSSGASSSMASSMSSGEQSRGLRSLGFPLGLGALRGLASRNKTQPAAAGPWPDPSSPSVYTKRGRGPALY